MTSVPCVPRNAATGGKPPTAPQPDRLRLRCPTRLGLASQVDVASSPASNLRSPTIVLDSPRGLGP